MHDSEVRQLEILSAIDELRRRTEVWIERPTDWDPVRRTQSLLKRVLARVETLRIRLEAPLIVATFGGTGTGKSSLVNALVGEEVTPAGRQRPTTRRPVLIAHPRTDLDDMGLPLEDVDVVRREADILQDLLILDCPDPDTSEGDIAGSNLDRLRTLLPFCDVLLYVSTQQKYRSARVDDELRSAANGCRILFVQTHAALDEDIRDDWRRTLRPVFDVPDIYFVDSLKGLQEQQSGLRPSGEMGRLIDLLRNRFGASERARVRRANVIDLLESGLDRCRELLSASRPQVLELQTALARQKQDLGRRMAARLQEDLLSSHHLWERRLLGAVTERWGMSPFSAMLRLYNGLGGILASLTLVRARSAAQLAILGTIQGIRRLEGWRRDQAAESTLSRVGHCGLNDALLRESEIVIVGHLAAAGFDPDLLHTGTLDELRQRAAAVETDFVGDAGRRVDEMIHDLAGKNSSPWVRGYYELLFGSYLAFVLYRVGKNFFYDSLWSNAPLLSSDFYLAAGLFFVLWSSLLIIMFTRRLRRGLSRRVQALVADLVESRLGTGLFPQIEAAANQALRMADEVEFLAARTTELRHELAGADDLGRRRSGTP